MSRTTFGAIARLLVSSASDAAMIHAAFKRPPPHWDELPAGGVPGTKAFQYAGIRVLSQLVFAEGDTSRPEWRVSVARARKVRPDDRDMDRVRKAFGMEAADEIQAPGATPDIRTLRLSVSSAIVTP